MLVACLAPYTFTTAFSSATLILLQKNDTTKSLTSSTWLHVCRFLLGIAHGEEPYSAQSTMYQFNPDQNQSALFILSIHACSWLFCRTSWIHENLGMVTLAGSQIWWTWETEDVFRRVHDGQKHAMKDFAAKLTGQLSELTAMVGSMLGKILQNSFLLWVLLDRR
jgi:hypothetical protein